jgi:membrane-bound lytic murein transglycosylase D
MYHPVVKSIPVAVTDYEPKTKLIYHTIKKGENLHKIATKYDVEDREILKWNNLRSAKSLKAGKRIKIFKEDYSKPTNTPKPVIEKQIPVEIKPTTDSSKNVNFDSRKFTTYIAKRGDTYFSIAKKFPDVTVEHIYTWNNLNEKSKLNTGDKIKIYQKSTTKPVVLKPDSTEVKTVKTNTSNFTTHVVKTGESLSTIAKKYPGATVEKIMKWNNLSSPDKLNLGQKLKIMKP